MSSVIDAPIWKEAPRYCTGVPLPPYRYLPGKNLHPDEGHLPQMGNQAFLYGVDLYHAGFFFEAHEAWESIWLTLNKLDLRRTMLMGLIQNSAAMLKLALGQSDPARQLSRRAFHYIDTVSQQEPLCMGLQILTLLKEMQRYYQPLWQGQSTIRPTAPAPRLMITANSLNRPAN